MFDWDNKQCVRIQSRVYSNFHGKEIDRMLARCTVKQLVADCSSFNMGDITVDGSSGDRQLNANALIHYLFRQYQAQYKEEDHMWKVVLSDYARRFENNRYAQYYIDQALTALGAECSFLEVKGWTGDENFQIRVYQVSKDLNSLNKLELPKTTATATIFDSEGNPSSPVKIRELKQSEVPDSCCEDW